MNTHCNRCGRSVADLLPEAPPPGAGGGLALDMEDLPADGDGGVFLICRDCYGDGRPYGFCGRCGQPTAQEDLRYGWCDWCRAAETIPFEEPDDDGWWEGRTPG